MPNKLLTAHFTSGGLPQLGLTPTIDIFELDPLVPIQNTQIVTADPTVEIGMGWYRYDFLTYNPRKTYVFSFDGGNTLVDCDRYKYGGNESYVEDISAGVWDESAIDHTDIGTTGLMLNQIKADTGSLVVSAATIVTLLNLLLKYERNRTMIDVANSQLIIFDDDCVTPLTIFDLKDFNGMPSVQEVCQRVPIDC